MFRLVGVFVSWVCPSEENFSFLTQAMAKFLFTFQRVGTQLLHSIHFLLPTFKLQMTNLPTSSWMHRSQQNFQQVFKAPLHPLYTHTGIFTFSSLDVFSKLFVCPMPTLESFSFVFLCFSLVFKQDDFTSCQSGGLVSQNKCLCECAGTRLKSKNKFLKLLIKWEKVCNNSIHPWIPRSVIFTGAVSPNILHFRDLMEASVTRHFTLRVNLSVRWPDWLGKGHIKQNTNPV